MSQVVSESSTLTVLSGGGSAVAGQPLTFTATVTPIAPATGVPRGYVLFEDGPVPIGAAPLDARGVATITTSSLGPGSHTLSAVYAGDGGYAISTSAPISFSLAPSLAGTVYLDLNADGTPDPGDPGLAGQVVFLDLGHEGAFTAGDPTAVTDVNGQFVFPTYAAGSAPVIDQSALGAGNRYRVSQQGLGAGGSVVIGVVPASSVAPVPVALNAFPTSPVPPAESRESFVQSLYSTVLGRAGSAGEVAALVRRMDRGMTRRQVVERLVNSLPHHQAEVAAYYQEFLNQAPGAARTASSGRCNRASPRRKSWRRSSPPPIPGTPSRTPPSSSATSTSRSWARPARRPRSPGWRPGWLRG